MLLLKSPSMENRAPSTYKDKNRLKVKGNVLVFMSNENDTQKSKVITPSLLIVRAQNYWCICVK